MWQSLYAPTIVNAYNCVFTISQLIVHSSHVTTPKQHQMENVLYPHDDEQHQAQQQSFDTTNLPHSLPLGKHEQQVEKHKQQQYQHNVTSKNFYGANYYQSQHKKYPTRKSPLASSIEPIVEKIALTIQKEKFPGTEISAHKSNVAVTISNSEAVITLRPHPPATPVPKFSHDSQQWTSIDWSNCNHINSNNTDSPSTDLSQLLNHLCSPTSSLMKTKSNQVLSLSLDSLTVDRSTVNLMPTYYRSKHRLLPISTFAEPVQYVHHPTPQYSTGLQKPSPTFLSQTLNTTVGVSPKMFAKLEDSSSTPSCSSSPTCQSMITPINDFEHSIISGDCIHQQPQQQQQHQHQQQQAQSQKFLHLDPNKNQRVPNPALKALQKGAVQLYFDRQQKQHQQQQILSNFERHLPQSQQNSPTALSTNEIIGQALLRNSLPDNYVSNMTQNNQISSTENTLNYINSSLQNAQNKPISLVPPPPPPRSKIVVHKSNITTMLRRSPSDSHYVEVHDQFKSPNQEKPQSWSIKNISQTEKTSFNKCGVPPPPPPRNNRMIFAVSLKRTSLPSDNAETGDNLHLQQAAAITHQQLDPSERGTPASLHHQTFTNKNAQQYHHYYRNHRHHTQQNVILLENNIVTRPNDVGNNWVPERPPKNSSLRVPSPDLPPPPALERDDSYISDEPLPPPPREIFDRTQPILKDILENRRNRCTNSSLCESHNMKSNYLNSEPKGSTLVPQKPSTTDVTQMRRSVGSSTTQIPKYQQSDVQRATITTFSTRKRPHNTSVISSSAPQIGQESSTPIAFMSSSSSKYNDNSPKIRTSPPPPLMPRILNTTESGFPSTTSVNCKRKGNSIAAYFPSQSLDKADNSNSGHASCKITLQSNDDVTVGNLSDIKTKTNNISYNTLTAAVQQQQEQEQQHQNDLKLSNNLPDVLPLGFKLQPTLTQSNISLVSDNSSSDLLYYGFGNSMTNYKSPNNNDISQMYHSLEQSHHQQQQNQRQHQQLSRYSVPSFSTFNLTTYQSMNTTFKMGITTTTASSNNNNDDNCPRKYVSQLLMDFKKNLKTTIEGQQQQKQDQHHFNNCEDEIEVECNNTLVKVNYNKISRSGYANEPKLFKAGQLNATLPNSPYTIKKSVVSTRQEPLRENIQKITQLQSQLMSVHIQDNNLLRISNCNSGINIRCTDNSNDLDPVIIGTGAISNGTGNTTNLGLSHCKLSPAPMISSSDLIKVIQNRHDPVHQLQNDICEVENKDNKEDKEQKHDHIEEKEITKPDPQECKESKEEKNILSQLDDNMNGLILLQRSELILRVNPSTVEMASQTDDDLITNDADSNFNVNKDDSESSTTTATFCSTTLMPRQKHTIELDCDKLAEELVPLLPPDNRLLYLLRPKGSKTITDYVSQLYNAHVPYRPGKRHVGTSTATQFYGKLQRDFDKLSMVGEKWRIDLYLGDMKLNPEKYQNLNRKLHDFIKYLQIKARILAKEHIALIEESAINDELGKTLIDKLINHVKPLEASKCRSFIADMGHITDLLLALSERLAKTENRLNHFQFNDNITERKMLENRRDNLYEKLREAKRIKEDIDRRGVIVCNVLEKQLSADDFADFLYFINMKVKLITDSHEVADNIKTGEEILHTLSDIK